MRRANCESDLAELNHIKVEISINGLEGLTAFWGMTFFSNTDSGGGCRLSHTTIAASARLQNEDAHVTSPCWQRVRAIWLSAY